MNQKGYVIKKDEIIAFEENEDHDVNLGKIIYEEYESLKDYLIMIAGIPRVSHVYTGCAMITYMDDIVILNTFDGQFQVYLPEDLNILTMFQVKQLSSILETPETAFTIASLPKDPDKPMVEYTKEILLNELANKAQLR